MLNITGLLLQLVGIYIASFWLAARVCLAGPLLHAVLQVMTNLEGLGLGTLVARLDRYVGLQTSIQRLVNEADSRRDWTVALNHPRVLAFLLTVSLPWAIASIGFPSVLVLGLAMGVEILKVIGSYGLLILTILYALTSMHRARRLKANRHSVHRAALQVFAHRWIEIPRDSLRLAVPLFWVVLAYWPAWTAVNIRHALFDLTTEKGRNRYSTVFSVAPLLIGCALQLTSEVIAYLHGS